MSGLEFIAEAQKILPFDTQYIVMTGWGELDTAIDAMRLGVVNYLTKPIEKKTLVQSINQALEKVSAIRREQLERYEESQKNALIYSTVQTGVMLIKKDSYTIVDANAAACSLLDGRIENISQTGFQQYFFSLKNAPPEKNQIILEGWEDNTELLLRDRSGQQRIVQLAVASICLSNNDFFLASFMDVSKRKKVEAELLASQETFSAIVERSLDGIVILEKNGNILFINQAAATFFGRSREDLLGGPFGYPVALGEAMELTFSPQESSMIIAEMRVAETHWQGQAALVATLRDITERKKLEDSIKHMATHDSLTGLPNRNLLPVQFEKMLALAKRNQTKAALLFIDLDNFKPINDNFGHAVGDVVLQKTAKRLSKAVRASDLVARVGGDEFIVVLQEVRDTDSVALVTNRIIASVSSSIEIDGLSCQLGASVGVSLFPDHSEDPEELIQMADDAMYQVKNRSKNNYWIYSAGMEKAQA